MTFGSLFAGVGAIDLGLERAGMSCRWQVEINPYCGRVLAKHWPRVERFADVREFSPPPERVDVLCGGFPCQDISYAGRGAGLDGERSGLWAEYSRIIGTVRPRYVVVENVPALLARGLDRVCGDLAVIGYDAEWQVVGCDSIGGSQHRKRLWILAYPHNPRREGAVWVGKPYPSREAWASARGEPLRSTGGHWPPGPCAVSDIPRMADGAANRLDRLRCIGNAVVPQIPEWIGRCIIRHAEDQT